MEGGSVIAPRGDVLAGEEDIAAAGMVLAEDQPE
jgi:hypothetical protein